MDQVAKAEMLLTIGCTATDSPPRRGSKPVREPGVIRTEAE